MTKTDDRNTSTRRRPRTGLVSSVSGDKTISVIVQSLTRHARYGKYVRSRTKLAVHDPQCTASVGDTVEILPCRPVSKRKSWRLVRVVSSSKLAT